jgi:ribosomal protein L7Ae-like RNA K-turn-binding protein
MIYLEGTMIGGGVIKSFLRRTDNGATRQDYVAAVSMTAKQATTEKLNQVAPSEHAAGVVPPVIAIGEEAEVKVVDAVPTAAVSKYVEAATAPKQPRHTSVCMMSVKKANDEIDKLIQTTLNTLAGYQKRLKENEPLKAKQKMRFVCGLKQCLNGVKSERAILVLVAPDTEESEALDSKLDDLIREAQAREIPILFCLSRRKLAKSILASTRQAAVAVYNADGVFKEVQRIAQYAKAGDSTTL